MNDKVAAMVKGWLVMHNGDVEALARWMSKSLRLGGLKACRALISEAVPS